MSWTIHYGDLQVVSLPAAKAEHITKNIPTAILFSEDGSKPFLFKMGSTSLSFKGMRIRISTASNMVSQAAGNCKGRGLKLAIWYLGADFYYYFTKKKRFWLNTLIWNKQCTDRYCEKSSKCLKAEENIQLFRFSLHLVAHTSVSSVLIWQN